MARRFNPTQAARERVRLAGLSALGYIGEDAIDWVIEQARSVYDSAADATAAAMEDFRQKVAQFKAAYAEMLASRDDAYRVGMGGDFEAIRAIMDKVQVSIESTLSAYQSVRSWVGLGGLGFVPLIGAAVVAGIVAAIVYALHEYAAYNAKLLDTKAQLIQQGRLDPRSLDAPGVIGQTADLLKWGLVGAAVLLAWPIISKAVKR